MIIEQILKEKVFSLIDAWEKGTACLSFVNDEHPACKTLISLGEEIVPIVLERLKLMPSMQCLFLLRVLTDVNPVKEEHQGKVMLMAGDWLKWGESKGYFDKEELKEYE